jgi:hypothetical protein
MLATSGLVVAARQPEPETTLVASGDPDDSADERPAATTTTAEPTTTTTAAPVTTVVVTTTAAPKTTVPSTTIPPATTTTVPAAAFAISPDQPLSASSGAHYMLAGTGCTGARVMLYVHGGQFAGEFYDTTTPLPDGTWGIGMMVAIPGTYEMRATCVDAGGATLFDYAPRSFTILQ